MVMCLVNFGGDGYTYIVAEKKATGLGIPINERRTTATWRYFFVRILLRAFFNGRALVGTASAVPACFRAGIPTLSYARPPVSKRVAN